VKAALTVPRPVPTRCQPHGCSEFLIANLDIDPGVERELELEQTYATSDNYYMVPTLGMATGADISITGSVLVTSTAGTGPIPLLQGPL